MLRKDHAAHDWQSPEPRLYRVVADRIEELIRDERIRPGERLPSERDMATRLGVSRAVAGRGRGRVGGSGKRSHVSPRKRARPHEPASSPGFRWSTRVPYAGLLLFDRGG